jgi:membrane-associated phospholipid phosphatase
MAGRVAVGKARRFVAWLSIGGALACAAILLGLTLFVLRSHGPSTVDVRLASALLDEHESRIVEFAERLVTYSGSKTGGFLLIVAATTWWWIFRRDLRPGILLAAALTGTAATATLLKHVVGRVAPLRALHPDATVGRSFPSLHAAILVSICGMGIVVVVLSRRSERPIPLPAAVALAAAATTVVAVSMMRMGQHWLTDILAGAALAGIWVFVLLFLAYEMWTKPALAARLRRGRPEVAREPELPRSGETALETDLSERSTAGSSSGEPA